MKTGGIMDIVVRTVKIEDLEKINVLYKEVDELHIEKYPDLFKTPAEEGRRKKYIEEAIESSDREIFIAEKDGDIAGLAEVIITKNQPFSVKRDIRWVALDNLVVSSKYKKMGIGSMLVDCVIDWARDWNINRIELKVYEKNEEALRFYINKGFETLNRTMFLKID